MLLVCLRLVLRRLLHKCFLDSWPCIVETREEHSAPIPTSDRHEASAGRLAGGHCTEASDTVSHALWKYRNNILLPYPVLEQWSDPCIVETREEHSAPIPTSDWHTTWTGRAAGRYCATASCTVVHALWKRERNIPVPHPPMKTAGQPADTAPMFPKQSFMHCGNGRGTFCPYIHQ